MSRDKCGSDHTYTDVFYTLSIINLIILLVLLDGSTKRSVCSLFKHPVSFDSSTNGSKSEHVFV